MSQNPAEYVTIDHDAEGNAYVLADFEHVPYFDGTSSTNGEPDVEPLVAKLTPTLEVAWSERLGGVFSDRAVHALDLVVDSTGRVRIIGTQWGEMRVGDGTFRPPVETATAFVLTLDGDGQPIEHSRLEDDGLSFGLSIDLADDSELIGLWRTGADGSGQSWRSIGGRLGTEGTGVETCELASDTLPARVSHVHGGFVVVGQIVIDEGESDVGSSVVAYGEDCTKRWSSVLDPNGRAGTLDTDRYGNAFVGGTLYDWTAGFVARVDADGTRRWATADRVLRHLTFVQVERSTARDEDAAEGVARRPEAPHLDRRAGVGADSDAGRGRLACIGRTTLLRRVLHDDVLCEHRRVGIARADPEPPVARDPGTGDRELRAHDRLQAVAGTRVARGCQRADHEQIGGVNRRTGFGRKQPDRPVSEEGDALQLRSRARLDREPVTEQPVLVRQRLADDEIDAADD